MSYETKVRRLVCCNQRADKLNEWAAGQIKNPDTGNVDKRGRCNFCGRQARTRLFYVSDKQAAALQRSWAERERFYQIFNVVDDPIKFDQYREQIAAAAKSRAAEMDLLGLARLGDARQELEAAQVEHSYIMSIMPRPGETMQPHQAVWLRHTAQRLDKAMRGVKAAEQNVKGIEQRRKSYQQTPELVTDEVDNPNMHETMLALVDDDADLTEAKIPETVIVLRNLRNDTFRRMAQSSTIQDHHLKTGERLCTLIDIVSGSGGSLLPTGMPSGGGFKQPTVDYRAIAALELADVQRKARNQDAVVIMLEVAHGASIREMASRLYGNTARVRCDEVSALVRTGLEDASLTLGFSHVARFKRARVSNEVWHNPEPTPNAVDADWATSVHPANRPKSVNKKQRD